MIFLCSETKDSQVILISITYKFPHWLLLQNHYLIQVSISVKSSFTVTEITKQS